VAGPSAIPRIQFEFRGIAIRPPAAGAEKAQAIRRSAAEASEREAEHHAEAVMRTQQQQTRVSGFVASPLGGITLAAAPRAVRDVVGSTGQPLDAGTRAFMEARFGHDFSRVQVHCDARAAESADAVKARAYTVGDDIVFGRGEYAPSTAKGRRLMAHELTHVVQQWSSISGPMLQCAKTAEALKPVTSLRWRKSFRNWHSNAI
jgi:Domain of unknown function (DUF4157)